MHKAKFRGCGECDQLEMRCRRVSGKKGYTPESGYCDQYDMTLVYEPRRKDCWRLACCVEDQHLEKLRPPLPSKHSAVKRWKAVARAYKKAADHAVGIYMGLEEDAGMIEREWKEFVHLEEKARELYKRVRAGHE